MGKKSKSKGARGERQWRDFLRRHGHNAMRTWKELHDVFGMGRYWEVKFYRDGFTPVYSALEEFKEHEKEDPTGHTPIAAVRQNDRPWLVVMYAEDWVDENAKQQLAPSEGDG